MRSVACAVLIDLTSRSDNSGFLDAHTRGRFLQWPGDYERRDTRSTRTPQRPCR
jgi:hypothetical protein